jgi:hypothetical protein
MSHVKVSFDEPEYTANADGIGTLRLLEALRILGLRRRPGLPGQHIGIIWPGSGCATERNNAILSA